MIRRIPAGCTRAASFAVLLSASAQVLADPGMWTFDNAPVARVKQDLGVTLSPDALARMQRAAVYFDASAAFVSTRGLMLTNHHVAMDCIAKLSTDKRDLTSTGHLAATPSAELRCPGGVARTLLSTEDVTQVVRQAMAGQGSDAQRNAARKSAIAELETSCGQRRGTGAKLHCSVVSLYGGSLYHLYRSLEWDDVRLVFAPEAQAANFGGDADNFVYPRFALDVALLRVYENGKPLRPEHVLKLADRPVREGEPVFVVGHPGHTDRLQTLAQLEAIRDTRLPMQIASAEAQRALLAAYAAQSPEAARQAFDILTGTENWLKSMRGELAALKDPALMARKRADETMFRAAYAEQGLEGDPWADVEAATARYAARAAELWAVNYGYETLFDQAGRLVELAHERRMPESRRLAAYREAAIPAIERRIKAEAPFHEPLEVARLAGLFREAQRLLGDRHPYVEAALAGASPDAAAARWMAGTRLHDASVRAELLAGGVAAIDSSDDSLIRLARLVYPMRRELARFDEEQIGTPLAQAAEQLGKARFAIYGRALPPDATGTLRLSYGKVAGYVSNGIATPWKTTFGGLFARSDSFDGRAPFDLSRRTAGALERIDPRMPLNFVTTADITGGNSGSPVVNANGEWVGVVFDTNLEALGGRFVYTDTQARSVAVDAHGLVHALDRIYGAHGLARELRGR